MEGLIILVFQLILVMLAPVLAVASAVFGLLLELVLVVFGGSASGPRRKWRIALPPGVWRWLNRVLLTVVGLSALVFAGLAALNAFAFERSIDVALDRARAVSGYAATYDAVDGNLLTGTVAFEGLKLRRDEDTGITLDLDVARFFVDVDLVSILRREVRIEALIVTGVAGEISVPTLPETPDGAGEGDGRTSGRRFRADVAEIRDVDVRVTQGDKRPIEIAIATASAKPFRSRAAAFDIFFRSTLSGRVDGTDLLIETREISDLGRETRWRIEGLRTDTVQVFASGPPTNWLDGGEISLRVDDRWDIDDRLDIDAEWEMELTGVAVRAPDGAGLRERALAGALGAVLDRRDGNATFGFAIRLDEEQWAAASSADLSALWDAVTAEWRDSVTEEMQTVPAPPEEAEEPGDRLTDRIRGLFDRE